MLVGIDAIGGHVGQHRLDAVEGLLHVGAPARAEGGRVEVLAGPQAVPAGAGCRHGVAVELHGATAVAELGVGCHEDGVGVAVRVHAALGHQVQHPLGLLQVRGAAAHKEGGVAEGSVEGGAALALGNDVEGCHGPAEEDEAAAPVRLLSVDLLGARGDERRNGLRPIGGVAERGSRLGQHAVGRVGVSCPGSDRHPRGVHLVVHREGPSLDRLHYARSHGEILRLGADPAE